MKKILLFLALPFLLVTVSIASQPTFKIPKDSGNNLDVGANFSGIERVWISSVTDARLVLDRDDVAISDGFIHWILRDSTHTATTAHYLVLRDTGTANTSSPRLLPHILRCEESTDVTCNAMIRFHPPVPFFDGLSANIRVEDDGSIEGIVEFAIGVSWKRK